MQAESFLSPNVRHLISEIPKTVNKCDKDYLISEADGWHKVKDALIQNPLATPNDFVEAVTVVLPFAKFLHHDLSSKDCFWTLQDNVYTWLSGYDMFPRTMSLLVDEAEKLTCLLRFVSTIERALGDISVELGETCPFLLRDLLLLSKLECLFGVAIMKTLRILLGNPHGINLRNLAWHGFLQLHEIPDLYISLLWFVVKEMAQIVRTSRTPTSQRPIIRNSSALILMHERLLESPTLSATRGKIIPHCNFPMIRCLRKGHGWLQVKRYGDCVILLLPCLEAYMRIIYGAANGCEHRVVTAESSEFYTTMDEILSKYVDGGEENRFRYVSGDGVMVLLMDLFQIQDGPRLRDKLSHGEMSLEALSSCLAAPVLLLTLKLYTLAHSVTKWCCCNAHEFTSINTARPQERKICSDVAMAIHQFDEFTANYCSLFHPLSIATRSYCSARSSVIHFGEMPYPNEFKSIELDTVNVRHPQVPTLTNWKTLFRNGKCEITNLTRRIAKEIDTSASNVIIFLRQRWQMHNERTLRSRQRANYSKMIERLEDITDLFVTILLKAFRYLQMVGEMKLDQANSVAMLKDLRRFLKTVENLRTLTSDNKWEDVCLLKHLV